MPAELTSISALVLSWGATYLLHSTLLVAGVWVFLRIRRDTGHGLRELLWKTALVGGLATASSQMLLLPSSPLGSLTWMLPALAQPTDSAPLDAALVNMSEERGAADATADTACADSIGADHEIWIVQETNVERDAANGFRRASEADASAGKLADGLAPAATGAPPSLARIVAKSPGLAAIILGLAAITIGMLRSLWQTLALSRKLALCTSLEDGPAHELLDELCRLVPRAPPVRLLAAADDAEPAALGVRQWTIVLPRRAVTDLSTDELRSLLAHELAHLARGDAAWLWISRCVCSCLAFQPLNQFARREWQRAAEFLCDSWAVHRTGTPLALARCLMEVASWRLAAQSPAASLAATGRKSGLVDRIERLLDARPQAEVACDQTTYRQAVLYAGISLALLAWCAPRVTVIAAGSNLQRQIEPEPAGSQSVVVGITDIDEAATAAADDAKLQAIGESNLQADDLESKDALDGASERRQSARQPAVALGNVPKMIAALDRDLAALEVELGEIEPLFRNVEGGPQAAELAARLHSEIDRLKQRRQSLMVRLRSVVR
jgi:beta-lactamase regulating signal transducer with metallopeptidase domain